MSPVRRVLAAVLSAGLLVGGIAVTEPAGAAGENVLVVASADPTYVADVVAGLTGTGVFASVTSLDLDCGGTDTIDETSLVGIDSVLVMADCGWPDADALGDLMADFVDGGGHVVETTFTLYCATSGSGLGGRWAADGYGALQGNLACDQLDGDGPLGLTPVIADSPLLAGVDDFSGGDSSYRNTVDVAADATLVATWDDPDSTPLLAAKTVGTASVVGLNFYPPSTGIRADFWDATTDGWTLLANALEGAAIAPVEPPVVPPVEPPVAPPVVPVVAPPNFTG